ncbi:nucleotidyltransferase domain-containing protein [Desulfurobacterium atlanticum]|uniref:Nucleotidyltransferase domain-containing protein n=1 Tax=Desulfurobacterium atlanticum TaxID=240169 RepID=A0A238XQ21_9BACT|nr:nucleotidyltransferase domain-containing protein [Desulfurobacterium atlanticum]SNR60678.1 Nucleotidyltransferase domain-containing protein [Desulfurobacterium atlanticum]
MKVRLTDEEILAIKRLAQDIFGDCEVYIFGSRLKEKKGGDIDIYIVPEEKSNLFKKKLKLSSKLENLLGKPVDVVVNRNTDRKIEREALKGVKL